MQPLKTYEVKLRKARFFEQTVSVQAHSAADAMIVAKYKPETQYSYTWAEDDAAECVQAIDVEEKIDFNKAREHYEAVVAEAKVIPGMEAEA